MDTFGRVFIVNYIFRPVVFDDHTILRYCKCYCLECSFYHYASVGYPAFRSGKCQLLPAGEWIL